MKKIKTLCIVLLAIAISARANDFSEFYSGKQEKKFVCSLEGVSVRAEPSLNSEKIGGLPNYTPVIVLGQKNELVEINKVNNYWELIDFKGKPAWIFGAFLVDSLAEAKEALSFNGRWEKDKIERDTGKNSADYAFRHLNNIVGLEFCGFSYDHSKKQKTAYYEYYWRDISGIGDLECVSYPIGERGFHSESITLYKKEGKLLESIEIKDWGPIDGDFDNGTELTYHLDFTFSYKKSEKSR